MSFYAFLKRATDIALALVMLLFVAVLTPIVKIGHITSGDHGPIFFSQMREGYHGKPFRIWKFRSMVPDADIRLQEIFLQNQEVKAAYEAHDKFITKDPRITKFGWFLRRSSLDELPQAWNILRGEMSLVGPRPHQIGAMVKAGLNPDTILSVKPGLTGYASVNGRSLNTLAKRKELEEHYVAHRSIWLDFKIILKTVGVVITGYGVK